MLCQLCFAYALVALIIFIVVINCVVHVSQRPNNANMPFLAYMQEQIPMLSAERPPLRRSQLLIERRARDSL